LAEYHINAAMKDWTQIGIAADCTLLPFRLHCDFPRQTAVRIPQREEETSPAVVALPAVVVDHRLPVPHARLPFHQGEAAEHVLVSVRYRSQSVHAPVAVAVECLSGETVEAAVTHQIETLLAELFKQQKVQNDS
jgi:hypothetical protein